MITLKKCPVCNNKDISKYLSLSDYFLSKEEFSISRCNHCGLLFTNPRPEPDDLPRYYQSEDYLSHNKEKKGLFSNIYNLVRNRAVKQKFDLITGYTAKGFILDIGCGTGEVLHYFSKKGWVVTGIEPAANARNFAIEQYALPVYDENQIERLPSKSFDVITLWHVLEHVPQPGERMEQIKRLLKDNGVIFIALPNHKSWDAKRFGAFWAGWDVPRHLFHFSRKSFSFLAARHGFKISKVIPMKFDAYYVSLLSRKYQTGKMNFPMAFYSGLRSNFWARNNENNFSSLIYVLKKEMS